MTWDFGIPVVLVVDGCQVKGRTPLGSGVKAGPKRRLIQGHKVTCQLPTRHSLLLVLISLNEYVFRNNRNFLMVDADLNTFVCSVRSHERVP